MDASNKQETLAEKFAAVWEKKNSKVARAGGVSLMALSLAACGSSSTDTAAVTPTPTPDPEPTTPVTPTPTVNTITKSLLDFASGDTLAGTDGDDVLNVEINSALGATTTISAIETINVTGYGALSVDFTKITDVTKFVSTDSTGQMTLNNISDTSMTIGFAGAGTNDIVANYKAGTLTGNDDTLNIDLNGASAVAIDADAGFENISLSTGGVESAAGQAATAASSLTTLTVPGVTTIDIAGAGALTLNSTFSGLTSIDASTMTGAIVGKTINATTGLSTEGFTGAAGGTTVKLGSAADNIKFTDATSAATKSNTIKLGAGDDTADIVTGGSGATYVFGEAGDDTVQINGIASTDLVDLGAGDDTLIADGTNASAILRGVENVTVNAGATLSVSSADSALAVTAKANGGAVDVTGLSAGSSVTVTKAATATQATNVTVGYTASEEAATVEVGGGMSGTLTLSKIADATVNLSAASDISGAYDLTGVKSFTLNATGALSASAGQNVTDSTGTNVLATVDINGTKAVDVGTITSTAMTTVSVDAASGDLTYAAIGADSKKLASVELAAAAGAIAGNADIGKSDNAAALSVTASAKNAIDLGAIVSTKVGDVSITNTNPLAKDLDVGAIGANATSIGAITMSGSGDVTIGLVGNATPAATSVGAINLTSTLGKVDGGTVLTDVKDATGIEVNLTAQTTIDSDGSGTAMAIENTGGNITGTLAGAAAAVVDYTAQTAGIVNLTATNTGGLTTVITNAGTVGAGETSTINLGNAAATKTNSVELKGTVDNVVINGGTGADTISFNATNDIASGTIALGTGTNTVDFTEVDTVSSLTDTSSDNGIVINLSSSTVTFDASTAYVSTVASGKATGYDANGDENHATQTSTKVVGADFMYSLSGISNVVGSDAADYIVANSTGTQIEGGTGADTIVLGAGADKYVLTAADQGGTAGVDNGGDTVSAFTSTSDKVSISGALETALDDISADGSLVFASATNGARIATAVNITTTAEAIAILGGENANTAAVTAANLGDISMVAALLEQEITLTAAEASSDDALIIIEASDTDGTFGVYLFTETSAAADDDEFNTDEITLLGIVTADAIATTDIEII